MEGANIMTGGSAVRGWQDNERPPRILGLGLYQGTFPKPVQLVTTIAAFRRGEAGVPKGLRLVCEVVGFSVKVSKGALTKWRWSFVNLATFFFNFR